MPLTKNFNETVKAKLQRSEAFRRALLREAVSAMLSGDLDTGKSVLRKYINGTIGFVQLGSDLERSPKALMRMFGPTGNPQAKTSSRSWPISRRSKERFCKSSRGQQPERLFNLFLAESLLT